MVAAAGSDRAILGGIRRPHPSPFAHDVRLDFAGRRQRTEVPRHLAQEPAQIPEVGKGGTAEPLRKHGLDRSQFGACFVDRLSHSFKPLGLGRLEDCFHQRPVRGLLAVRQGLSPERVPDLAQTCIAQATGVDQHGPGQLIEQTALIRQLLQTGEAQRALLRRLLLIGIQARMQILPIAIQAMANQAQTVAQTYGAIGPDQTPQQQQHDAQVATFGGELERSIANARPLPRAQNAAVATAVDPLVVVTRLSVGLQLIKTRVVAQFGAAGGSRCNRLE